LFAGAAAASCDSVSDGVMGRLAVGGSPGGVYWVPTSTARCLGRTSSPSSSSLSLSTAGRLGALVGVSWRVELWIEVAGLDAWLEKTCDEDGESR